LETKGWHERKQDNTTGDGNFFGFYGIFLPGDRNFLHFLFRHEQHSEAGTGYIWFNIVMIRIIQGIQILYSDSQCLLQKEQE